PILGPDDTLMVRQYRYALARETLEFPAGKLDPGEDPIAAAHRELAEETGYKAGRLDLLLSFAPAVGYSTEIIHVFMARDLEVVKTVQDFDEIERVERRQLSQLRELVRNGEIVDGTTMVALAAYEWLGTELVS
ncbi:MAG: NUDIX hydrolase, partial [Deltaproteobacteria bacterium]|nr:NUDIX hydrolase [Deltaproteobacteria bacterium]